MPAKPLFSVRFLPLCFSHSPSDLNLLFLEFDSFDFITFLFRSASDGRSCLHHSKFVLDLLLHLPESWSLPKSQTWNLMLLYCTVSTLNPIAASKNQINQSVTIWKSTNTIHAVETYTYMYVEEKTTDNNNTACKILSTFLTKEHTEQL